MTPVVLPYVIIQTQNLKKHGNNVETDSQGKKLPKPGKMYAAGWHRTMGESGIDLSYYTVRKSGGVPARERAIEK